MTQSKNSSIIQLTEVFPTWSQEDLSNVLNEAGGDVYVAITRISEGHVSQWSDSSKKATTTTTGASVFESRPARNERSDRGNRREGHNYINNRNENGNDSNYRKQRQNHEQRDRPQTAVNRAPIKSAANTTKAVNGKPAAVNEGLSWGESTDIVPIERISASMASSSVPDKPFVSTPAVSASRTSFADAAASALPAKPANKPITAVTDVPVTIVETEVAIEKTSIIETSTNNEIVSSGSVAQKFQTVITEKPVESVQPVVNAPLEDDDDEEEEDIVSMPTIATPSLTMEQPAVLLPVRTNLRTNLSVRFGYDATEELVSASEIKSADDIQPSKTPITVSVLESTFAMMSTTPVSAVKSPEPVINKPTSKTSSWEQTAPRVSGYANETINSSNSGYGNFSRGRQNGGWDYEPSTSTTGSAPATQETFGPAPGFSGPASPIVPQRFVSRAASQYENPVVAYNSSAAAAPSSGNSVNNSRFSPYEESNATGNNVSQYYTSRGPPQSTSAYPYRGGNSLNAARYNGAPNRPYYQQNHTSAPVPHYQPSPPTQQQSAATGHYTPYIPHQNYLNNYNHGYGQYPQHADQYSHQHHQQQHAQPSQQPYYQPYQPPNQYLSNPNMNHQNQHGQNQHYNA